MLEHGEIVQVIFGGWWMPVNILNTRPGQMVRFNEGGPVFIVEEDCCTSIRVLEQKDFEQWKPAADDPTH